MVGAGIMMLGVVMLLQKRMEGINPNMADTLAIIGGYAMVALRQITDSPIKFPTNKE